MKYWNKPVSLPRLCSLRVTFALNFSPLLRMYISFCFLPSLIQASGLLNICRHVIIGYKSTGNKGYVGYYER